MNPAPPPRDFYDALARWQELKAQIAVLQVEELALRQALAVSSFPAPREGANRTTLRDGRQLVLSHKINRTVDAKKLKLVDQALAAMGSNRRAADFMKTRYDLLLSEYRTAPESVRKVLDQAITLKPGTPNLEVKSDAVDID